MMFYLRLVAVSLVFMTDFCIINMNSRSPTGVYPYIYLSDSSTVFGCASFIMELFRQWKSWTDFWDWCICLPIKFWMLASISSTVSLPYSVIRFLGVLVELAIMMIFAPVSIHTDCSALSASFLLNRLTDLDSPLKSYGSFRMALLNSLIPVAEV